MKLPTWLSGKSVPVTVVNEALTVGVTQKPYLVTVFENKEIAAFSKAMGPLGGLDLTGYGEYRLVLRLEGPEGTAFSLQEFFGPAGTHDQVSFDIGGGQIGPGGVLHYRARFDIYAPRNFFVQIANHGEGPIFVNGTLYAVQ